VVVKVIAVSACLASLEINDCDSEIQHPNNKLPLRHIDHQV
jgi:hypothetical protein